MEVGVGFISVYEAEEFTSFLEKRFIFKAMRGDHGGSQVKLFREKIVLAKSRRKHACILLRCRIDLSV